MLTTARLALVVVIFALALLILLPAPNGLAWRLEIAIGEAGYYLIPLLALLAVFPWKNRAAGNAGRAIAVVAAVILLRPLMDASRIASGLDADMATAFAQNAMTGARQEHPLSIATLLGHSSSDGVRVRTMRYHEAAGSGPDDDNRSLDLYTPSSDSSRFPIVITIHGGSWGGGTRRDLPELNYTLARRGFAVAAVSYRLAPEYPFPAADSDIHEAVSFLKSNAAKLSLDPARIVLVGRSAGAHLALLAAYEVADPSLRGVVSLYGPTDLRWSYSHPSNPRVLNSTAVLESFLAGPPERAGANYDRGSPINFARRELPPTLLIHGAKDELVSVMQSDRLAAALSAGNRKFFYLRMPWATHGCDYFTHGPCGQLSTFSIERFLDIVMK